MSNLFKAGDLALTLISLSAARAGSVVTLDERVTAGQIKTFESGTYMAKDTGWLCTREGCPVVLAYADRQLMPLRGDFAPDQQKSQELVA